MILRTVHFPATYDGPGNHFGPVDYGAVVGMLADMLENCVLVSDPAGRMISGLTQSLDGWPPVYQKRAKELLFALKSANRIVGLSPPASVLALPLGSMCDLSSTVSARAGPDATLVPQSCRCGTEHSPRPVNPVNPAEYPFSEFAADRRRTRRLNFGPRELSQAQLEDVVWKPILRYAHSLTLIDRYIGRHIDVRVRSRARRFSPAMRATWIRSLDWILDLFSLNEVGPAEKEMTVVTGLQRRTTDPAATALLAPLRAWAGAGQARHGFPVRLDIRSETGGHELPHDRYLVTDQGIWHVGGGFELLYSDSTTRALTISTCLPFETGLVSKRIVALPPRFP